MINQAFKSTSIHAHKYEAQHLCSAFLFIGLVVEQHTTHTRFTDLHFCYVQPVRLTSVCGSIIIIAIIVSYHIALVYTITHTRTYSINICTLTFNSDARTVSRLRSRGNDDALRRFRSERAQKHNRKNIIQFS